MARQKRKEANAYPTSSTWYVGAARGRRAAAHGGGSDGDECGGDQNNRLFLATDAYLHERMVETWDERDVIADDGGSFWKHTGDLAGPHDPFDASIETDTGLRCALFFETGDSEPPAA